jgi:hypothetical protein
MGPHRRLGGPAGERDGVQVQVDPFFGNNFNSRSEEAIGSATDIWVAYREGRFGKKPAPFLGYFFLLEDFNWEKIVGAQQRTVFQCGPGVGEGCTTASAMSCSAAWCSNASIAQPASSPV